MSRREKVKVITKQFIVDQLTDNEVDLSMNELSTVPVKELVKISSSYSYYLMPLHFCSVLLQEEQDWTCLGII